MSDPVNDGGPVFPNYERGEALPMGTRQIRPIGGMKLRDYFAAKALKVVTAGDHVDGAGDPERHSALAYAYADAMLKAREVKP